MPNRTLTLTEDQITFYHREGYLTVPAITSAEEVEHLCGIYDRLFESKAGRESGDHLDLVSADDGQHTETLPQILNPTKYAPELSDTVFRANAMSIATQLLGPETIFRFDHAIRKPPQTGAPTPWHQDEAYWDPAFDYHDLSIWIPLQAATFENGCMQFVPGSHKQEVLPHHSIGHNPRVVGLEADNPGKVAINGVACPLAVGGATIHHSRTMHSAGPNLSSGPRRAYIIAFGTPPHQRPQARDFYWLAQQKTE